MNQFKKGGDSHALLTLLTFYSTVTEKLK